jgi:hypothetical protein
VLRQLFGPKRKEVTEGWRKLRNEELHYLYNSTNIIRMMISKSGMGHVALMRENRNAYRVLVWKPEKRLLGRPTNRW